MRVEGQDRNKQSRNRAFSYVFVQYVLPVIQVCKDYLGNTLILSGKLEREILG